MAAAWGCPSPRVQGEAWPLQGLPPWVGWGEGTAAPGRVPHPQPLFMPGMSGMFGICLFISQSALVPGVEMGVGVEAGSARPGPGLGGSGLLGATTKHPLPYTPGSPSSAPRALPTRAWGRRWVRGSACQLLCPFTYLFI